MFLPGMNPSFMGNTSQALPGLLSGVPAINNPGLGAGAQFGLSNNSADTSWFQSVMGGITGTAGIGGLGTPMGNNALNVVSGSGNVYTNGANMLSQVLGFSNQSKQFGSGILQQAQAQQRTVPQQMSQLLASLQQQQAARKAAQPSAAIGGGDNVIAILMSLMGQIALLMNTNNGGNNTFIGQ